MLRYDIKYDTKGSLEAPKDNVSQVMAAASRSGRRGRRPAMGIRAWRHGCQRRRGNLACRGFISCARTLRASQRLGISADPNEPTVLQERAIECGGRRCRYRPSLERSAMVISLHSCMCNFAPFGLILCESRQFHKPVKLLNFAEHYRQTRPCTSTIVRSKIPYFSRTFSQKQKKA